MGYIRVERKKNETLTEIRFLYYLRIKVHAFMNLGNGFTKVKFYARIYVCNPFDAKEVSVTIKG